MIKFYRSLLTILIAAVGLMSWYFGLYYQTSVLYIADQYVPLGIHISWTFLVGSVVLLADVLTTTVHKIHRCTYPPPCTGNHIICPVCGLGWAYYD